MNKIILIAIDTLRADHLGSYGYVRDTSPRLDRLAEEGALFENCISQTGHTLPTFTTIMTGRYPLGHGIVSTLYAHPDQPDQVVSDEMPMLAQLMREGGWETAAFDNLGEFGCGPKWLTRGYDWYVSNVNYPGRVLCNVLAEDINARLLPWLRNHMPESLFLFVHYWDVHQPYNEPEPYYSQHVDGPAPEPITASDGCAFLPTWGWESRLAPDRREYLARYDGEITYVDACIGRLLDELRQLGVYEDAWIIVTSDHGEDMEEHNAPFEHRETYDCNVRVPLIVKPPHGWPIARKRIEPLVGHIDILPTVLGIAGLEPPKGVEGRSLLPLMSGDLESLHSHLFIHGGAVKQKGRWQSGEVAVRTQDHKYIVRGQPIAEPGHARLDVSVLAAPPWRGDRFRPPPDFVHYFNGLPKQELYDLRADPCEIDDLAAASPDRVAGLRDLLVSYVQRRPDLFAGRMK